jgi:hypothetical protein
MKNTKKPASINPGQSIMLWSAILGLTALRIVVATGGSMNENEALLSACSLHPADGYIEGPAGTPLFLTLLHLIGGTGQAIRWVSPLAALILSWALWRIARHIAPHRPALALWSVLGANLLPPLNIASLTMNGAMLTATWILLSVVAGWQATEARGALAFRAWALFGITLAITTLFYQPAGILLPTSIAFRFVNHGAKEFPWKGVVTAVLLLLLGWVPSISWNARHDWIQWNSVAVGFDAFSLGRFKLSQGVLIALTSFLVPFLIRQAYSGAIWRMIIIALGVAMAALSSLILLCPSLIPGSLSSPLGVQGLGDVAEATLALRGARPAPSGEKPFLIASTPGLAALLGSRINIVYPERPGSPSVFAVESPSLASSYALWPSYADAVAAGVKDPLYTEEKSVSPFLGRNALYITTESKEELPQTITGAFGAVGLLKEVPVTWNGRAFTLRIYQCENYRTLAL